jgi:type IV secretion system pilin
MESKNLLAKISSLNLSRIVKSAVMALVIFSTVLAVAQPVNAGLDAMKSSLDTAGAPLKPATGESGNYIPGIVANLINAVLAMIGVLLLGYLLYAGFLWMTAGGDEGKVKTAITMIRNSIVGLLIIVLSFVIADFVLSALISSFGAAGP